MVLLRNFVKDRVRGSTVLFRAGLWYKKGNRLGSKDWEGGRKKNAVTKFSQLLLLKRIGDGHCLKVKSLAVSS